MTTTIYVSCAYVCGSSGGRSALGFGSISGMFHLFFHSGASGYSEDDGTTMLTQGKRPAYETEL